MRVTAPSACPWLAHPVSGLLLVTSRPVQTRFRCAFASRLELATKTNSLTHYAKGTPSPAPASEDPGRAPTVGRHPVSGSVSLPALGCFSPYPHGTGALSVTEEYLGLEGGPPTFGQGFTCPALLEDQGTPLPVPGCHRLWRAVPDASGSQAEATGLVRVRSPLLAESRPRPRRAGRPCCCPFLRLLRWFSSPGSPRAAMDSPHDTPKGWVAPFGHPRITGRSPLPSAFRSVPRPSSPLGTKASTRCPCRAAPAPSPQHARSEVRWQRTDVTPSLPTSLRSPGPCAHGSPADARASASRIPMLQAQPHPEG